MMVVVVVIRLQCAFHVFFKYGKVDANFSNLIVSVTPNLRLTPTGFSRHLTFEAW